MVLFPQRGKGFKRPDQGVRKGLREDGMLERNPETQMAGIWWDNWRERGKEGQEGRIIPTRRTASTKASDVKNQVCSVGSSVQLENQRGEIGRERAVDTSLEGS